MTRQRVVARGGLTLSSLLWKRKPRRNGCRRLI